MSLTKGAIVTGSTILSPMFFYFKIKKGRFSLWAYHRNVVMNSGKILKLSDTNLEGSWGRIFKPDSGRIVSQMCSAMFRGKEYGWRSSVLSLEKKNHNHCWNIFMSRHWNISKFWSLRACLHGGRGPQVGEVPRLGGVTRLSICLSYEFDHIYMIGGVTRHMLPHLPGVPHLHVNRPLPYNFIYHG